VQLRNGCEKIRSLLSRAKSWFDGAEGFVAGVCGAPTLKNSISPFQSLGQRLRQVLSGRAPTIRPVSQRIRLPFQSAIRQVRQSPLSERLSERMIVLSTMPPSLKAALAVCYAGLFALALLTAARPWIQSGEFFRDALGLHIPRLVMLGLAPTLVVVASFAFSAAIQANIASRWGFLALLAYGLYYLSLLSATDVLGLEDRAKITALAYVLFRVFLELEAPVAFLVIVALLRRRLPWWGISAGCLIAFGALAIEISRLNGSGHLTGAAVDYVLLISVAYLIPALLVVGADMMEWSEIIGEAAAEAISSAPKGREWILAALAILLNLGFASYWLLAGRLQTPPMGADQVGLDHFIFACGALGAGLAVIFAVLASSPAKSTHPGHFGYVAVVLLAYLIVGAPTIVNPYSHKDAPEPTKIFRLRNSTFSIDLPPGWHQSGMLRENGRAGAKFASKDSSGFFGFTVTSVPEIPKYLNEIIGTHFPKTELKLSPPNKRGWRHFAATLVEYGDVPRPWLGIQMRPYSEGVEVTGLSAGGPAAAADIEIGDVVTKIDDQRVTTTDQLLDKIQTMSPGTHVALTLLRHGKQESQRVTLGELPAEMKSRYHFTISTKDAPYEVGRTDVVLDAYYVFFSKCEAEDTA
jgi:hypothetical protein